MNSCVSGLVCAPRAIMAAALCAVAAHADCGTTVPARVWLEATPGHLPRWRGFNLLEKFSRQWSNGPFREEDFKLISMLGFNFVRLPMDYRCWTKDGEWTNFDERVLGEIDQAVAWGGTYGIHVCINFHRAPGYTVASPAEARSLWTDAEAQRVCALHWAAFARRYRGIPNNRLSFNLLNEPAQVDSAAHARVVALLVKAIRAEDPSRLIIADGINYGTTPCPELAELGIAQATRGYQPVGLTHYRASWMAGSDLLPVPCWPTPDITAFLNGPAKPGLCSPLVIRGSFPTGTHVRLHVGSVSARAEFAVRADKRLAFFHDFVCGPGSGEWKSTEFKQEWNIHQCLYDRDWSFTLDQPARSLEFAVTNGDWMTISEIGIRAGAGPEHVLPLSQDWGQRQSEATFAPGDPARPFIAARERDRVWLQAQCVQPWQQIEQNGVGVMVGEWGAFNKTPHDMVLRWMKDCLTNWRDAGWGWALWNFRGSFGVLDSDRPDVRYEDFHGHKLDREMLDLLQSL